LNRILAPVISNTEIMPGVYLFRAKAPTIAAAARPGQFVMVRTSDGHNPLLRRPLSIHRVNDDGEIALLYDVVGRGTDWLSHRDVGESIDMLGPLGNGFTVDSRNLLLVAGGCGIAPLIFLADAAMAEGRQVVLLYGADTAKRIFPEKQLPRGLSTIVVTEDGSMGRRGLATDFIAEAMALLAQASIDAPTRDPKVQIFACGPNEMYLSLANSGQRNDNTVQVSLEAHMGCGLGLCFGCTIETRQGLKRVCKDGPVFDLKELLL
jgi:dihydroorotate dehydrogenase electron transfer subunit